MKSAPQSLKHDSMQQIRDVNGPLSPVKNATKREAADGSQYFTRAVSKALEILEILRGSPEPVPLTELARRVKLAKASAFRLLRTLQMAGYVDATASGQYCLSPDVQSVLPSRFVGKLISASAAPMRNLNQHFRETVSLAALFSNHIEVLVVLESPEMIRMSNIIGRIVPPNASSLGKAIAAYLSEERREKLIRSFGLYRFTSATITDGAILREELDRVRARGYATDEEESVADGFCFGVPIFTPGNHVTGAISVSMPKMRWKDKDELIAALLKASGEISVKLS